MNISTKAIVSSSDMIKNYKACREKTESLGRIFILKNNQPNAVLFSINEYRKVSELMEYIDNHEITANAKIIDSLPKGRTQKKIRH